MKKLKEKLNGTYIDAGKFEILNNQISLQTLSRVMRLGELGEQIMLKSRRAFESIHFQDAEVCDSSIWYPKRELREQRQKNINHARADYIIRLSKALKCEPEMLMELE